MTLLKAEILLFVASTHLAKMEAPNQWDFHFSHTNDDGWLAEGMKMQWGVVLPLFKKV